MKNSNYDKTTVIGVVVSLIAFVLILYFRPGMPKPQPRTDTPEQSQTAPVPQAEPAAGTQAAVPQPAPAAGAVTQIASMADSLRMPLPAPVEENLLGLKSTDKSIVRIDKAGAGVQSVYLNDFFVDKKHQEAGDHVVLGSYDYPFLKFSVPQGASDLGPAVPGEITEDSYTMSRKTLDGKLEFTETWRTVPGKDYELSYTVSVRNLGDSAVSLAGYRVDAGAMPTSVAPDRKARRGESAGGASFGTPGGGKSLDYSMRDLSKLPDKEEKRLELLGRATSWTAVHSKYFLLAVWMKGGLFQGVEPAAVPGLAQAGQEGKAEGRYRVRAILPNLQLPAGAVQTWEMTAYAGPKSYEILYSYNNGLDTVMELDRFFGWRPAWMRWISRWLLKMLVWISQIFPKSLGYGLAVILLTLLVKVIFWPLSHKSTVSMRKMQALKPQLDEIKAKYKDDAQTMYRKQQELFKANNVSQLGGCLPMLLQIPVFFALFNTFRNAIELRHASFLWAYDLSMPDTLAFSPEVLPIRPFAILMGVGMYFQQTLTPNPDPQQAKMMNFMTIFFIFLFYGMPSALTLYLTISYALGIAQTYFTNRLMPPVQLTPSASANAKTRKTR